MKKTLLAATVALGLMAGQADAFTLDLTDFGGGTYTTSAIGYQGVIDGIQTAPNVVGSTFTQTGYLGFFTVKNLSGVGSTPINAGGYNLYLYAQGLTGTIVAQESISDYYTYNSGVGAISIVLDTDWDFTNGVDATLATLSLTSPSGGTSQNFVVGGTNTNSAYSLSAIFTSALDGVFSDLGYDYANLPTGYTAIASAYGNGQFTDISFLSNTNEFAFTTESGGQFTSTVVPEPSTMMLLGLGMFGLAVYGKRRMDSNKA